MKEIALAVCSAAIVITAGVWLVEVQLKPSPAETYLRGIRPSGYESIYSESAPFNGGTASTGVFVGPIVSDEALIKSISSPGLVVKTTSLAYLGISSLPDSRFSFVALESASASECSVEVGSLKPKAALDPGWHLSPQEIEQVQAGASMIVELQVSCGLG